MSISNSADDWQSKAANKRQQLYNTIPSEWRIPPSIFPPSSQLDVTSFPVDSGFFTESELAITSASAATILEQIRNQEWTAIAVARAFSKRAAVAHQLTNCLSETLFSEAFTRAQALDEQLKHGGKLAGPLHGLPISLKDNFETIGTDSTLGFTAWIGQPATSNSTLVDLLISLGAVPYVKTNVPTAMMIAETVNHTFGRTLNPRNRLLAAGGSSGGEAALIAFGGSVVGVGTDIGGSVRIPAACTGIYTLKPSFGRFPTAGSRSALAGQEAVNSINGPLARSLDEVELFASCVVGAEPWRSDPKCLPIPWRQVDVGRKLRLGVLWSDGIVAPTPPVQRALAETVKKLKAAGHELIDWDPELHDVLTKTLSKFFLSDGGQTLKAILEQTKEPLRPEMSAYGTAQALSVAELWKLQAQRTKLMAAYLERWKKAGIDGILSPTTPYATVEHGKFKHVGYTGVFNVLDYSATSFPTGLHADKDLDTLPLQSSSSPLSEEDARVRSEYNAEAVHGMPISLQLVANRLEEEKVLAMTRLVVQAL